MFFFFFKDVLLEEIEYAPQRLSVVFPIFHARIGILNSRPREKNRPRKPNLFLINARVSTSNLLPLF